MTLVVRQATVDDARLVADVINSVIAEGGLTLFDAPFSESQERAFIEALRLRSVLHVAAEDDEVVGVQSIERFATFSASTNHVATMGTWLRPTARGRGIGRRLATESFAFAQSHDYEKVMIQVLAGNQRALRFYRSLGFVDIGVARQSAARAPATIRSKSRTSSGVSSACANSTTVAREASRSRSRHVRTMAYISA